MSEGLGFQANTPIQKLHFSAFGEFGVEVNMKRDDLIHPFVSGNKWRKLRYNLDACREQGKDGVVTYGGAYSNHLLAVAVACASAGLKSVGLVRGDELSIRSNYVLRLCDEYGMKLHFLDRRVFDATSSLAPLGYESFHFVPMGGANREGVQGCTEILPEDHVFNHIVLAVGTGTTFRGVVESKPAQSMVHGISVVPKTDEYIGKLNSLVNNEDVRLHFPDDAGIGKWNKSHRDLARSFASETGILLDPVYMSPVISQTLELMSMKLIKPTQNVLIIHSGGMTGILSDRWLKAD
ncbi:MAG: pyridoxal-phosphate dependent enzyme [Flavobacteriales bacterium]|nr:pyridoxal-phosphate dependent enzyme [Bacteroidota bacterium]MCB9241377.1 pyridoxal-phosphate dependent enzyme [Flavobacteriales bacterium]